MDVITISPIGKIRTDFPEKFGLPRQAGAVKELKGRIEFYPEYARSEAFTGLSEYSHIWVLWLFSENIRESKKLTVRPPALGGNTRVGVFATRSPFRPNNIGLSCLALDRVENDPEKGPVLYVSGIDMMDNTPVIDIKPYIPMWDSKPEALEGGIAGNEKLKLELSMTPEFESALKMLPEDEQEALTHLLCNDPRPAYQKDRDRIYGLSFAGHQVKFSVKDGVLSALELI